MYATPLQDADLDKLSLNEQSALDGSIAKKWDDIARQACLSTEQVELKCEEYDFLSHDCHVLW